MRTRVIAAIVFLVVAHWSNRAVADVTIQGTVGEVGVVLNGNVFLRLKFTDLNQTKTCNGAAGAGYAWLYATSGCNNQVDCFYKDIYAMALVSKKGTPMSCTIDVNTNCRITGCTLP